MNERLKKLRKALELTQQEFADKIGMKRNTVANYETNRNTPSTAVISLICREFNVNEEWLRHGIGDMFLPEKREDEIARMVKSLLSDETNTFKSRFISMLARLSVSDWERLEMEAKKLLDDSQELELAATNSEHSKPMTVEKAEAEYIKSRSKSAKKTISNVLNTTEDITDIDNKVYKIVNQ